MLKFTLKFDKIWKMNDNRDLRSFFAVSLFEDRVKKHHAVKWNNTDESQQMDREIPSTVHAIEKMFFFQ